MTFGNSQPILPDEVFPLAYLAIHYTLDSSKLGSGVRLGLMKVSEVLQQAVSDELLYSQNFINTIRQVLDSLTKKEQSKLEEKPLVKTVDKIIREEPFI